MAAVRAQRALEIEEEYNSSLRSQSNMRFLSKKQRSKEMEALLETQEDLIISPVLHNKMVHRRTSSEIELAMTDYFDASTEALEMCRQLLHNIKDAQSNYQSMDSFLASISAVSTASSSSASAPPAFNFPYRSNPFFTTTRSNLRPIHDKYSCILQSIRSSHRRLGRKLKIVKAVKKLLRALVVMAGGAAAVAAFGMGAHMLVFGLLLIGMATTGPLKTWLAARASTKKPSSKTISSLMRLQEQLDTAAKGTYVLGQDLDTVSNLVAWLSDGIERENAMARCCAERANKRSSVLEMVNELRRSCSSSKRLTDELEEHVCMFLATIQRARNLVIQEISKKDDTKYTPSILKYRQYV